MIDRVVNVLIAEDDATQRTLLSKLLQNRFGHETVEAENGRQAIDMIIADTDHAIDIVIMDLDMPLIDGRVALRHIRKIRENLPVIIVTSHRDANDVEECMEAGANDFLNKPISPERIHVSVQNALRLSELDRELQALRTGQPLSGAFTEMIGHDTGLRTTVKLAQRGAASDITILVTGESGVGKEVLARAIHEESARSGKPFVAVNCGAIPSELVESTLFGHKKGAFTGAIADSPGKFREADGGTLFLDEIGELAPEAQVRLLRALQQREIEPVGEGQSVPVNVRIIAATHRNLAQEVERNHFREDLFYRLNIFPVHLPPLRERKQDILPLAHYFLERYNQSENTEIEGFTLEAENWLKQNVWQGNVRELENALYRAVLLTEGRRIGLSSLAPASSYESSASASIGHEIPDDIPDMSAALSQIAEAIAPSADKQPAAKSDPLTIALLSDDGSFKPYEQIRDEIYQLALNAHQGHIMDAAKALNIGKSTLYRHVGGKES